MLIIWPVYQIIFISLPVYQIQLYLACKCLLWHCMLIYTKTIKTFNMQKNCLTIETLYLFINRECNHKHKEIFFFSKNLLKKYSKHSFGTAISYIQAKCNDFK